MRSPSVMTTILTSLHGQLAMSLATDPYGANRHKYDLGL